MAKGVEPTGPKRWEVLELEVANAINVGDVTYPDLHTDGLPLLKIFEPGRWQVAPQDLELLKPSIQLASNLVRVGMPYITSFLPVPDNLFINDNFLDENGDRRNLCPNEIDLKENPSKDEVAAALDQLELLAPFVRWQTNSEIYAGRDPETGMALGWMGITRLVDQDRPWGIIDPNEIRRADDDSLRDDLEHRPLIIGIMQEFVDAIKDSPKSSEQRLRATFMAGVTMAHEVGHVIYHQDFRSFNPPDLREPYVGDGVHRELGISFITSIFNGFHPNGTHSGGHKLAAFTGHLQWVQHYKDGDERPKYKTLYSIAMSYVQEKLTKAWWDGLPSQQTLIDFSSKAKEGLKPVTDLDSTKTATAREAEWYYSWETGAPRWTFELDYRTWGFKPQNRIDVSEEEILWQKAHQPRTAYDEILAAKDPQELRQAQRSARAWDLDDDGDEEEEFFEERANANRDAQDAGGEEDDEEGGFGGMARSSYRDATEPTLVDLQDGIIEKDVIPSLEDDTTPLTRIVVRYLPPSDTSAKRSRDDNNDCDNHHGHHGPRAKKPKLGSQANTLGARGLVQTKTMADDFLERSTPFHVANTMSRLEIHKMCINRRIPGYRALEPTVAWQRNHPNLEDAQDDIWVVNLLSDDMLNTALITLFKENDEDTVIQKGQKREARIQLKRASVASVKDWAPNHLDDFCSANGINGSGTMEQIRERIRNWKRADIEATRHEKYRDQSPPSEPDDMPEKAAANPENWTVDDLEAFCLQNDLPEVGTRTSLVVKVKKYLKDQASITGPHPRHPQTSRIDINGFEVYNFKAILGQSSVAALKSAFFIAGNFPPEAILTLYFKTDWYRPLQDEYPLLHYNQDWYKWEDLRVKVAEMWKFGPGSTPATAIDVDAKPEIHFSKPVALPGESIATAPEAPVLPVVTFGDEPTPTEILKAIKEDPIIKREVDVIINNQQPTLSELLSSIGDRTPRLDQFVTAGGRFQSGRAPEPAESGLSILEEIEDYEEEEDRRRALEALVKKDPGEGGMTLGGGTTYPPPGASHMGDLFHTMNRKWTPWRREEEDETE